MLTFINAISVLLPVFYIIVFIDYALLFFRDDPFAYKTVNLFLKITISLHVILIILRTSILQHIPISSVFEVLSAIALAIVIVYLYVEEITRIKTTGLFIIAIVFLFQLISSIFITMNVEINHLLSNKFFGIHVTFAIFGYSAITISAIYGFLYLMMYHDIKSSKFGLIYNRLPSLEILGSMNYNSALIAFICITLAIIFGSIWSSMSINTYWNWDPKLISVLITWIIFGFGIVSKKYFKLSGKKIAYISLLGFLIMLFSMLAVNLFFTTFHEFTYKEQEIFLFV
jgi:ABC-type transport system involved in cytochrome c biogenesis permease subunit